MRISDWSSDVCSSDLGNLVNRTATLINKNFGEIPQAAELASEDIVLLERVEKTFDVVGDLIGAHRQTQAIGEAMRAVADVNKYITDTAPWTLKGDAPHKRLGTFPPVLPQCVTDLNLVLSPFLPFSANPAYVVSGGAGARP